MNIKSVVFIVFFLSQLCWAQSAPPANALPNSGRVLSALETLFEAGSYPEFHASAKSLADQGNAEAQFLLGKAYHTGRGVKADTAQARLFYELAAKQKSARAEHNLGLMDLDLGFNPDLALKRFYQAEAWGFKTSILYNNIGRAHYGMCDAGGATSSCHAAAEAFYQAWQLDQNNDRLDDAAKASTQACVTERRNLEIGGWKSAQQITVEGRRVMRDEYTFCKKAIELTEKGSQLGLARATYNRGAIAFYARAYVSALPWLRLANERGLGLAAYQLAVMHQGGLGVPVDEAAALALYKRAAGLKNKQAVDYMLNYWQEDIKVSFDPERIKAAMLEYQKLAPAAAPLPHGVERLALINVLKANAVRFSTPLSQSNDFQISDRVCPPSGTYVYVGNDWELWALGDPDETLHPAPTSALAEGVGDDKGCIVFKAADLKKLKVVMKKGQTLMVRLLSHSFLLSVNDTGRMGWQLEQDLVSESGFN